MDIFKNIQIFRKQRHDFMNHIQIIYGYLQLEKENMALEYIQKISMCNEMISEIYALGDNILAFGIERNIKLFFDKSIKIKLELEIEEFNKKLTQKNYEEYFNVIDYIFQCFENNCTECVYIYFFEDSLGQSIMVYNEESLLDLLNCMDNWTKVNREEKINIFMYNIGDYLAYRIIF